MAGDRRFKLLLFESKSNVTTITPIPNGETVLPEQCPRSAYSRNCSSSYRPKDAYLITPRMVCIYHTCRIKEQTATLSSTLSQLNAPRRRKCALRLRRGLSVRRKSPHGIVPCHGASLHSNLAY